MKKLNLILAVCLVMVLGSCKKDKDVTIEDIVGTWNITEITQDGTFSFTDDSTNMLVVVDIESAGSSYNATATFTETTYSFSGTYNGELTLKGNGQTETQAIEDEDVAESGTLTLVDNKLTLSSTDGTTIVYDVKDFSDSKLIIEGNLMESDPFFGIDFDTDYRYGFSK